ncbi:MAG: ABC transporter ATP-binding protein [Pseudomonadota bacterium]
MRNAKALLRLFREFGDLRWIAPLLMFLGLVVAVLEGASLYLLAPIFETVLSNNNQPGSILPPFLTGLTDFFPEDQRLSYLIGTVISLIVLKNLAQYADALAWTVYDAKVNKRIQHKLFDRLMSNDARDKAVTPGQAINLFENQSWRAVDALLALTTGIGELFAVLFFVVLLFLLSWEMSLVILVTALVLFAMITILTRRVETLGQEVVETQEKVSIKLWDILTGLKTIRIFGGEQLETKGFNRAIDDTVSAGVRQEKLSAAVEPLIEIVAALLIGLLCLVMLGRDVATLPVFVSYIVLLRRLVPRIQNLIGIQVTLSGEIASVHKIVPWLVPPANRAPASANLSFDDLETDLTLSDLRFRYAPSEDLALIDVSLTVPKGKITGIAGPSGAGKSTLVDLLCRIATPEAGDIKVNGHSIHDLARSSWQGRLGVVPQEVHLFNASLRDNIAYGLEGVTNVEVTDAAKAANAHDFIKEHPEGYSRILSEGGSDLSGGQRQRIALARALLRKPSLLILDEATSALDPLAETLVKEAVAARPEGSTVIVIAHRASTLEMADHIVVLDKGRVVQSGSKAELATAPGLFQTMFPIVR